MRYLRADLAELTPQAFGDGGDGGLGGGVDGAVDQRGESAVARRGVHDMSFLVLREQVGTNASIPFTTPITLTSRDHRQSLTWCSHI